MNLCLRYCTNIDGPSTCDIKKFEKEVNAGTW